jgi:RNA polymerase sigma-54 factor
MSSVEIKATPKLVQQQRLILTQELQLFLKLIQMTTLELKEYIEQQLVENPVLEVAEERGKEEPLEPLQEEPFIPEELKIREENELPYIREFFEEPEEETPWENRVSSPQSLIDYLNWQLSLSDFSTEDKKIASLIIGNINDDGYLESELTDIAIEFAKWKHSLSKESKDLPEEESKQFYRNLVESDKSYIERVESVLKTIQFSFDPTGVGARNLRECLKIQAQDLGYDEDSIVVKIIDNHLEDIARRDYDTVAQALEISPDKVEEAVSVISSLEPKPGRPFYMKDIQKNVVPDFYVYKVNNELQVQVSRDLPRLRISNYYRNLINKGDDLSPEAKKYIKEKLEAAQRIIKCLEERNATVRKIITKIVEFQRDFFEYGKEYIKPLRLKDIAQAVGVHESTVSRITSRRYIQTPIGTVELKAFFSRKIGTSNGKEVSFERVKALIKDIISNEPPERPYSDEDISKILEKRNIKIARRTIAKYRKILKIPSSSERAKRGR